MRFLLSLAILAPLAAQTLLQQNFDTRNYRAGSTTAGIQEAVTKATAAGGGTVVIPAGSFTLSSTVTISGNGITIRGAGGMCCGIGTTLHRTGDYGDSFLISGNGVTLDGFALTQDINYVVGNPGTISHTPTHGAHVQLSSVNTATLKNLRVENMPYGILIHNGVHIVVRDSQFVGLWDRQGGGPQVSVASILIDSVGGVIPTYIHLDNNIFLAYATSAASPAKHNAGPVTHVQIDACEDCDIEGGSFNGASTSSIWIHPNATTTGPILGMLRIRNVKIDSGQDQDLLISGDGVKAAGQVLVADNIFNGEYQSDFAVTIANVGSGVAPVENLVLSNNAVLAYRSTAFNLLDGIGIVANGNAIRAYNGTNLYTSAAASSAIYVGGRANYVTLNGNQVGGGQGYENFGAGGYTHYGISVQDPAGLNAQVRLNGNYPPFWASLEHLDQTNYGTQLLGFPDHAVHIGAAFNTTDSVSINCVNDANSLNIPCEIRGTKISLPIGVPTYADNAAALGGGLTAGDLYTTAAGALMRVF